MLFHFLIVSEVTGITGRGWGNTSGNQVDFRLRLAGRIRFVMIGILMFLHLIYNMALLTSLCSLSVYVSIVHILNFRLLYSNFNL